MKYLRTKQEYIDLYDQHTIEECRRLEKIYKETIKKNERKISKFSPEEIRWGKNLAKENFSKLEFSEPDISKDVIISFKVQDIKTGRGDYDSRTTLRNLIKKLLLNTNWRLMSKGVDFRLGILSGRLRGYEGEEDLLKL